MTEPTNYLPAEKLQKHISHYGILEVPEGTTEPYFSPPIGLSGFIIQSINTSNIVSAHIGDTSFFSDTAVATGQVTKPVYGQIVGKVKTILVFFQPLGMHQLFGTDMATLTNKAMELNEFLGEKNSYGLVEKLKSDQDSDKQIEVLNEFFLGLEPVATDTERLEKVLELVHEKKGGAALSEMEVCGNYHRKTLERHFKKMVGLSPKVYAKIYQFKCLINLLHENPGITWVQLSAQAGYYDQSHMSRYVKEYLKVSPSSIVQLDMDLINYLLK